MASFIRLVYVSRATFAPASDHSGIHPEVGRILIQSRRNNTRERLVGGLYYADGCFFQVLEGAADAVEALYQRLHDDPRHSDLKILSREDIAEPQFRGWAMKHVPNAPEVRDLMARHGRTGFDPYSFPPVLASAMVNLLLGISEPLERAVVAATTESGSVPRPAGVGLAMALGACSLLVSVIALAVALLR